MSSLTRYLRLLGYIKPYRVRLIAAVICSGCVAALTAAYAWLVRPVLDGIFISKDETLLFVLPLAVLTVAVLKSAFSYGQTYLILYVGNHVIADLRKELFHHFVRLPVSYHDGNTTGRLVSKVTNDVMLMANAVSGVLKDLFQHGLTFLAMMGVIFYQNWRMALLSLIVMPLAAFTLVRFGQRMRRYATSGQERMGDMASTLQETLAGIRIVKAYGREDAEAEKFQASNQAFSRAMLKSSQVFSMGSSHMEVIGVVGIAAIIWYGGDLVIRGAMTPGSFFSFLTAMFMAYNPVRRLSGANNTIQQALAAAERVFATLDLNTEWDQDRGTTHLAGVRHAIEFRNVSLRYGHHEMPALTGITLTIRTGELVALVGSSGSGKTTLASLLPRFYDPTEGEILVDGTPLSSYTLKSLRAHIGIVSQDVVLFDDTVRNNIAFGRTGASHDDVERAAIAAYAHDFIMRLPDKYDSLIGEQGLKLSGGERQRLAIARAILRDPPLLILDEATSALDTESERIVQLALSNLMKNRTTLVIAHRLSTVQGADRILVLEAGRIVEEGSHAVLMGQGGRYRDLCRRQLIRMET